VTIHYLQVTCRPPLCSLHLQAEPSAALMQLQLDFWAHCGSQLQAGPPLADSSQYQPVRHMPLPQGLQLPSSHAERGAAVSSSAGASSSLASAAASGFASWCEVALAVGALGLGALPPHAPATSAITLEKPSQRPD
jgi:hypothetical protein